MASNTLFVFGAILLLSVIQLPHSYESRPHKHDPKTNATTNPFGFIEHLEGCHKGQSIKGLKRLKTYMEHFGYLQYPETNGTKSHINHGNDDEFDELLEKAIETYQRRHKLNVSGILDPNTTNQMMKPRCGVPDIRVNGNSTMQNKRHHHYLPRSIHNVAHFRLVDPVNGKWDKTHLTYRFRSSINISPMDTVRSIFRNSFGRWSQVTRFTFQEVDSNSNADIEIGFHARNHGDGPRNAFEGPGGVLAHATPPINRAVLRFAHFDAQEGWSANPRSRSQLDLESVAVHEIGHLLGLDHSEDQNAIMWESFTYGITKRDLTNDDIRGIRTLYGLQ